MDDRGLRELELLAVARLYGLDARSGPAAVPAPASDPPAPGKAVLAEAPASAALRKAPEVPPAPAIEGIERMDWDALRNAARECRRCGLCEQRKQAVFGVGNESAPWLFVGEGPGADEDEQGEPFVGRAGQLLTKIIESIGLAREQVYIANVIKCRPPGNRNPEPDEVAACEPFLFRQVDVIKPMVIVPLGKFAAQCLLKTTEPITRLRGRTFDYRGTTLIPTFHPAYLLRNPSAKREVWEDMKKVRSILQDGPAAR